MDIGERLTKYSMHITFIVIIIMVAVLGYTLSKKYRVNKTVVSNELSLSNNMIYQTDYCNPRLRVRKLADFHIKSSHMTGLSGFQKADYISTDMIKNTLGNNVRYLEFSIFAKSKCPLIAST